MNSESILVVGTGALGTLFAARLSAAGIPVSVLGTWQAGLAALHQKGACLEGFGCYPVQTLEGTAAADPTRYALVLVKSWQTGRAARQLSGYLAQDGLAVSLQNGLGNAEILAGVLGSSRAAQAVTTLGATLLAPGLVRLAGNGPIWMEASPGLGRLPEMLIRAGYEVKIISDVSALVWGKLVVSSAINALTALLRIKNGELLETPAARALMGALASETASVAGMLGVDLPFQDPVKATEEVALRTAGNLSSMLQDVMRGAPTEVDAINGAIVHLAEAGKIKVPVNQVILSLVESLPVHGKI